MLRKDHASRFAHNSPLDREARLLWFVSVPGDPHAPAEASDPEHAATSIPGPSPVEAETFDSREKIFGAIEESGEEDGKKERPKDTDSPTVVSEKAEKAIVELGKTIGEMDQAEEKINVVMPGPEGKPHLELLQSNKFYLADWMSTLTSYKRIVDVMREWEEGKISPEVYFYELERQFYRNDPGIHQVLLEAFYNKHPQARNWKSLDPEERARLARDVPRDALNEISTFINKLEANLERADEYLQALAKDAEALQAIQKGARFGILNGVEFYSINHMIQAVKNVVGAFKKAGEEWSQLKVANLSNTIGELTTRIPLPFGLNEAEQTLAQDLEHKDEEVKDHYKKFLESDIASFSDMFHHHAYLYRNRKDANRFRGTLEYMASKGWLYDIDIDNMTVFGEFKLVPGTTLPGTWSDAKAADYIRELDNQNRAGEKKEMDRGYTRVENLPDIPKLIDVLDDELKNNNYWAVHGVVKRAIEKGKYGETSAWLCTTIMRYLRDNPEAHKYFPKGLMDKIGNIGIVSPVWLTTFFKLDRHNLEKFQQDRRSFAEAGDLAQAITVAEADVQAAQEEAGLAPLKKPELDHIVAKILASQTIKENSWRRTISVFDVKYASFRKAIVETSTSIKPGDADDDFFNPKNGGSEVVLMGKEAYKAITSHTTTGDWAQPQKAKYFLEQVYFHYQNLKEVGGDVFNNFMKETQEKMSFVMLSWNHPNNNQLAEVTYEATSEKLIAKLVKAELIPMETVRLGASRGYTLAIAVLKQLGETPPETEGRQRGG